METETNFDKNSISEMNQSVQNLTLYCTNKETLILAKF